jgi:hypothetical protein
VNQNSSTVADGDSGVVIVWKPLAAANYTGLFRSLGANTIWTVRSQGSLIPSNYNANGIALRESGTGKMVGVRYGWGGSFVYERELYTAPTTRTSTTTIGTSYGRMPWFRFRISGGTVYFDISETGESSDWLNIDSVAVATAFTTAPDQYGFYGSSIGSDTAQVVQSALVA